MVALIRIEDRIDTILEDRCKKYGIAFDLAEAGVISESLGEYMKTLVHMRSCLEIAEVFAQQGDGRAAILRIMEANGCLKKIGRGYGDSREELVELAIKHHQISFNKCKKFLRASTV